MRMGYVRVLVAVVAMLSLPSCGRAELIQATPKNFAARLAAAKSGDTLRLAPGEYSDFAIVGRRFSPKLTIEAGSATIVSGTIIRSQGVALKGGAYRLGPPGVSKKNGKPTYGGAIRMSNVEQVSIQGGRFFGPAVVEGPLRLDFGEGYGVRILGGRDVEVSDSQFEGFETGVSMTRIEGFRVAGNVFSSMRSDGLTVSLSRKGLIEKNQCRATKVRDKEHPDCIQMWSRPTAPPTADVVIRENLIEGGTQGIGLHNHERDGVDDGGFDRITIENNIINVSRANAISLQNGRASVVRNNKVTTLPGSRFRASIRTSGPSVTQCGNTVDAGAGKSGVKDKAC